MIEVDHKNGKRYAKDMKNFVSNIILGSALLSQGMKANNSFTRFFRTIGYSSYYLVAKKSRKSQFSYFAAEPNKKHLGEMISMHENRLLKNMYKINIPSVHLKKIIFVPMLAHKFKIQESLSYERADLKPAT